MKKIKFFFSLLKERDWLEEMASQGWLLFIAVSHGDK